MESRIRHYLEHYFALHPTQEVKEMFLATAMRSFAVASVGVFEPIYLYRIGFSIQGILIFYLMQYVGYFVLLPLGGRICRKHGYEHTIMFSSPFLILFYLMLFAVPWHPYFIVAAVVTAVLHKILYWPGYHANFAAWQNGREAGKEVSNRIAITALVSAFAPAVGGILIAVGGFASLFCVAAAAVLLSNLPLLRTPELFVPRNFSYGGAVRRLFRRRHLTRLMTFFGFGEQLIAVVVWPLYMALLIPNLVSVGFLVSLARTVNVLVTLYVGRLTDEERRDRVLASGTFFTAASWLLRPWVTGGLGVFLIDSYYRVSRNVIIVPFFSFMYSDAREDDIMPAIIFNEMSVALGKGSAALLALAAVWLWPTNPWTAMFLAAAAFTGFYSLMSVAERGRREPVPVRAD